ncbi:MAG: hypothetical protein ACYDHD_10910 [Vulcanimicrobiaceae bacterium]
MERQEAAEHLELVDRILEQSSRRLYVGGEFFVVWGCESALISLLFQLLSDGRISAPWLWLAGAGYALAIAFTVVRYRQLAVCMERKSWLQREFLNVLWLALGLTFVTQIGAFGLYPGFAGGGLWSFSASFVLFYIGMHGNRAAIVGGMLLLVSLIVAAFMPAVAGYALAAGMLLGDAGFGVASLLATDERAHRHG